MNVFIPSLPVRYSENEIREFRLTFYRDSTSLKQSEVANVQGTMQSVWFGGNTRGRRTFVDLAQENSLLKNGTW